MRKPVNNFIVDMPSADCSPTEKYNRFPFARPKWSIFCLSPVLNIMIFHPTMWLPNSSLMGSYTFIFYWNANFLDSSQASDCQTDTGKNKCCSILFIKCFLFVLTFSVCLASWVTVKLTGESSRMFFQFRADIQMDYWQLKSYFHSLTKWMANICSL